MLFHDENFDAEIVLATVGGIGVQHAHFVRLVSERLEAYKYNRVGISISEDILPKLTQESVDTSTTFNRYDQLMTAGNRTTEAFSHNGVLAAGAIREIQKARKESEKSRPNRSAFIITSFKRPEEVFLMRKVYGKGFYLFGIYSAPEHRRSSLMSRKTGMTEEQADSLIKRDEDESNPFGQKTRKTFQLADFFLEDNGVEEKLRSQIDRIVDLIFGNQYTTPTFHEYAMFQAFSASLRSADLSRQVGAVIANNDEILSSGANDCPKPMGGLYWPIAEGNKIKDVSQGRDYTWGYDTNSHTLKSIITAITKDLNSDVKRDVEKAIKASDLPALTEFGRMVHAEMEAILCCARNSISCRGATLYATTFPCHNCAKHIIAAGIKKVVYIEPYPKSRALLFYPDAITTNELDESKVNFSPFRGVGPRQFFDLFSMGLSSGRDLIRKDSATGRTIKSDQSIVGPRVPMTSDPYFDLESKAVELLEKEETL